MIGLVRLSREEDDYTDFPASHAQSRMWALQRFFPDMSVYNYRVVFRVDGELRIDALQAAVDRLTDRHESLRTTLRWDGRLRQRVWPAGSPQARHRVAVIPVAVAEGEDEWEAARIAAEREVVRPFDLVAGPLFRVSVWTLGSGRQLLGLVVHHAVVDAWSEQVLLQELTACYRAAVAGVAVDLPELPVQAADIAVWEEARLTEERRSRLEGYWLAALKDLTALDLLTDRPRPVKPAFRTGWHRQEVPAGTVRALRGLCAEEHVTPYMVLLGAVAATLGRWGRHDEVPLLAQSMTRPLPQAENVIGFFVNGLVLRVDLSGRPTFRQLAARVRDVFLDAVDHQDLPFDRIVELLSPERDLSRNPLAQVVVNLNEAADAFDFAGLRAEPVELFLSGAMDLDVTFVERGGDRLEVLVGYDLDLFDAATVERMADALVRLLVAVSAEPDGAVRDVPLLAEADRETVLVEWNKTEREYPYSSIQLLFEEQVRQAPDAVAVYHPGGALSYRELNAAVNRGARALRARGVVLETPVGVCLRRSPDMIVAVLAVLKAGGVYVPLDPTQPRDRLAFIIEDVGAGLVLADEASAEAVPAAEVLLVGDLVSGVDDESDPEPPATGANLAHVIYTSGSTGRPNAVAVEQHSVARLVRNTLYHDYRPADVFLQLSPLTFDASLAELWGPLLNGGAIALPPDVGPRATVLDQIRAARGRHPVTMMSLISPQLSLVVANAPELLHQIGTLMVGGDVLAPATAAAALAHLGEGRLLHMYGPTESTLFATSDRLGTADAERAVLPIGRPIGNTTVYIVDDDLQPVPVGVPGEIVLGGAGLARGYLGQPGLTARRFVPNPFSAEPGSRLYRTGDLARFLSDGRIEFLGRVDRAVKVRGYRIEPVEIDTALRRHPDVQEAVVVVRPDLPGGPDLVAYVVAKPGAAPGDAALRGHLGQLLPAYMVPGFYVLVPEIPLTRHAKVDLNRLPAVAIRTGGAVDEPRTETEHEVAALWRSLLGVPSVSRSLSFFEVGGNSVLLVQLAQDLLDRYGPAAPKVVELFEYTTVEQLAAFLDSRRATQP
jgi:amino acid adenylation domain-containing protein